MSEHRERNRDALDRLRRIGSLSDADLAKDTGNGWSVATVLGHMAFFDRLLLLRWDTYEKDGVFAELTPNHFDLINYAGAGDWSALPPRAAVARCIEAAEGAVARIEALPEEAVAVALETNRPALLERILHWGPHLDQIESAIGREI
ncbi:MAG TPA: maleylpyruvate isomerase N-terminal domain-containing protein [Candidatus Acidoferrum sp.]|nr:maleylpyruvate isomerase N-terminal domain-containing protein [Candidatus Acidoferrum sp.]